MYWLDDFENVTIKLQNVVQYNLSEVDTEKEQYSYMKSQRYIRAKKHNTSDGELSFPLHLTSKTKNDKKKKQGTYKKIDANYPKLPKYFKETQKSKFKLHIGINLTNI